MEELPRRKKESCHATLNSLINEQNRTNELGGKIFLLQVKLGYGLRFSLVLHAK